MNKIRVRFAPSPTGPIHLGSIRTALYNYLFACKNNGKFILRIEDTDRNRIIAGSEKYIIDSLKWCNIEPNEGYNYGGNFGPYRQSERIKIYNIYIKKLLEIGKAYYSFDKLEDIHNIKINYKKQGKIFTYNANNRRELNNSLTLSKKETYDKIINGTPYVIRIKTPNKLDIEILDLIRGKILINTNVLDDKILIKSDGMPTYHFASTIDDHLMKISHIIRGEEWLPSLPIHILLYRFFNWELPKFAHLPLILKNNNQGKLSKRDIDDMDFPILPLPWKKNGYISKNYSDMGYYPDAFINMLALLGWNPGNNKEIFSLNELIKEFKIENINKSSAHFNKEKAKWFNKKYLEQEPIEKILIFIKNKLKIYELNKKFDEFYIKKIIKRVLKKTYFINEIWEKSKYFFLQPNYKKNILKNLIDKKIMNNLLDIYNILLMEKEFKAKNIQMSFNIYINNINTNMKSEYLKHLRLSLVGDLYGEEIFFIMEMIGKKETLNRINNFQKILINS